MGETPVHQFVLSPALGMAGFVSCCLVAGVLSFISYKDIRERIIPNAAVGCMAGIWAVLTAVSGADALQGLAGCATLGGFALVSALLLDRVLGRASLGGGDVKLLAALGLYLGPDWGMVALVLACLAVVVFAVALEMIRRLVPLHPFARMRPIQQASGVPFAPPLALATLVCVVGEALFPLYS